MFSVQSNIPSTGHASETISNYIESEYNRGFLPLSSNRTVVKRDSCKL